MTMKGARLLLLGPLVAVLAATAVPAVAGSGRLVGTVRGLDTGGLPGATVVVTDEGGNTVVVLLTGEGGEFKTSDLPPGPYVVEGSLHGFLPSTASGVVVRDDRVSTVEVTLTSATFRDTMEVDGASPLDTMESSELRETGARDLGEALARMPGVWKVRKGGIANDVVLRGFRQDDVTVLIDGARVAGACPNRMDPPAFHIDFSEVDRIEVAPTTGRMLAQGSLGGMINVVTKKPAPGLTADASLTTGSWQMVNPAATVGYGGSKMRFLAGASQRSSAPYADGSGVRFTAAANYNGRAAGIDAYDVSTAWARAYFEPGIGHELNLSWERQDADDVLYPALMMDAVYDTTNRLVLGYRYSPAAGLLRDLRATAYVTGVEHWMEDSLRTSADTAPRGWSMGTRATTSVVGVSVDTELGPVTVGIEAYRRSWDAWTEMAGMAYRRQYTIPDVQIDAVGLSARWARALTDRTSLELGGRLDHVRTTADPELANTDLYFAYHGVRYTSRSDLEPSFSARVEHRIADSLSLAFSASRTTRAPDPRERYFALRRMGSDWVGNPGLDQPRATSGELGLTWTGGGGVISATAWVDSVDGYITLYDQPRVNAVPGIMSPTAQSYANVDAVLGGSSFEGTVALGSRTFLAGNVTWMRGRKDADPALGLASGNLAEMPPLTARLALRWQSPSLFVELEGVGAAAQNRVDTDLQELPTPGYGIANLRAGVSRGAWRIRTAVENLFDRTYHEHFGYVRNPYRSGVVVNEPGRSLTLIVGWQL